jgi:anti-sigma regulatory factor (Ser/Thr protein kinase)
MGYIKHNEKKYKTVLLKISKETDFSLILKEFHNIYFNGVDEKRLENIRYSLLELVNNSIRAHKERQEKGNILLRFSMTDEELIITLQDMGGGFSKKNLPYDLDQEVQNIDINNQNFLEYREKHGYHRFGMGLFITKKTFDSFILKFVDMEDNLMDDYVKDCTKGTYIELRSFLKP